MKEYTKYIQQAKRGDAKAFARLYEDVYRDLYRFAVYTLKNSHDAEDLVSETVMDAWAQIKTLRTDDSFRAWIFKILSNKCRQRLKEYCNKYAEIPEDMPGEETDRAEALDVQQAFGSLAEEDRLILSLHVFGGYSSREIGEHLHMSDSTVRSRQKRALDKMRDILENSRR